MPYTPNRSRSQTSSSFDKNPDTFMDIVAVIAVRKKEIGRVFKLVMKVELSTTGVLMSRLCGTLSLSQSYPWLQLPCTVYMAVQARNEKRKQEEIGDIAGVVDVTIRQSFKLLLTRAKDLFPEDFVLVSTFENLPVC